MKQTAQHVAVIVLVAGIVMFTNLGGARLWDRDEPRNAGCAREMIQRNDWVTPVFNGQLRTAKPVLLYWLMMSAYAVFGDNEFAARFWSAALAVGTVLATYVIGRRLFNARVALWGAIALATSLMFGVAGRAATPDSTLIFFTTLALMIFVLGAFQPQAVAKPAFRRELPAASRFFPQDWRLTSLMYGAMGLAVLAKGPAGAVLPTAVIGMFLLLMRLPPARGEPKAAGENSTTTAQSFPKNSFVDSLGYLAGAGLFVAAITLWGLKGLFASALFVELVLRITGRGTLLCLLRPFAPRHFLNTCWEMRPLTAFVVILAVAAPWYVWVGLRTDGEFLREFFLNEHWGRATTAMENHAGPLWFYVAAILVGFFPWSVFMAPMCIDLVARFRRPGRERAAYVFLACWVGVFVGLFSLATTKLPSYVTPCYPALALLAGCFLDHWTRGTQRVSSIWPRLSLASLALVGVAMIVGLPLAADEFLPGEQWIGAIGLVPLLAAAACFVMLGGGFVKLAGRTFAVAALLLAVALFGVATVRVASHQQNYVLFDAISNRSVDPRIASYGCLESSWVYYAGRQIHELTNKPASGTHSAHAAGDAANLSDPAGDAASFFARHREAFLITTDRKLRELAPQLPPDVRVLAQSKYFLKSERLVLLGRDNAATRRAALPSGRRGLR